jgi:hypothetical protein
MQCACNKEKLGEPMTLCRLHQIEFEKRLAAGRIETPREKLPSYFFEAAVECISSTAPHGQPGKDKFCMQLRCITQDESGMAEEHSVTVYTESELPRVGQRYEVTLKPT